MLNKQREVKKKERQDISRERSIRRLRTEFPNANLVLGVNKRTRVSPVIYTQRRQPGMNWFVPEDVSRSTAG